MLTKTDILVLKHFTSQITTSFTIRKVSTMIKKDLKIVHGSIKKLQNEKYLVPYQEKIPGLLLNYKSHHSDLAFVEGIRSDEFLGRNHAIKAYITSIIKKMPMPFFILILFGSCAKEKTTVHSDIDLLVIIPQYDESIERQIIAAVSMSIRPFHLQVIGVDSVKEMLAKREELNVFNETLNNHIIFHGAEQFYWLLGGRDVR